MRTFISSTSTQMVLLGVALALAGCAAQPRQRYIETARPAPVLPNTEVYAYPKYKQSNAQMKQDRFECYEWAVDQTGFDPSGSLANAMSAPQRRVHVATAAAPGHDTAVLAITGAVIGAAVSNPRNMGNGAAIGAVIGGLAGAASDSARQETAQHIEQAENNKQSTQQNQLERRASEYRRAMGSCLEGRGYSVH